ncbi:MAG: slipin family protein, partial [Rhabdochlamydiaceae bacterium]
AAQKMVDAANLYSQNPRAMELRWMNILYELGLQGRGTLMLVPTNMPTAGTGGSVIPPYGIMGVKDIQETGGAPPQKSGSAASSQKDNSSKP